MKTIGEFYRKKILLREDLVERELPAHLGNTRIERDLFGWRLYFTRPGRKTEKFIECRSEYEARYLKVFLESEVSEVKVPEDESYLKSILPELEKLKAHIDEIINFYTESLISRKDREKLRFMVWADINH